MSNIVYKVVIRLIATDIEIRQGSFSTEEEAWQWVEEHNCPVVDYDVIKAEE